MSLVLCPFGVTAFLLQTCACHPLCCWSIHSVMNLRGWLECLGAVQIGRKGLLDHVHSHNSVLLISLSFYESSLVILSFYDSFDLLLVCCLLWSMMDHSSSLDKRRHSLNKYGVIESFHDDPNAPKWQWTVASLASRHRTMTRYVRM